MINIVKALNITPQKPISNSNTNMGLMGLGSEPILDTRFTNGAQLKKKHYLIHNPCEKS